MKLSYGISVSIMAKYNTSLVTRDGAADTRAEGSVLWLLDTPAGTPNAEPVVLDGRGEVEEALLVEGREAGAEVLPDRPEPCGRGDVLDVDAG